MADNGKLVKRILRRFRSKSVEAAGIEPSAILDATENSVCDCENCQQCSAAYALHFECFRSQFLATLGIDLQCLIDGWERLDETTRHAIAAQIDQD